VFFAHANSSGTLKTQTFAKDKYYSANIQVGTYVLFNWADLLGRLVPGYETWTTEERNYK
jgi:hypothetical protein